MSAPTISAKDVKALRDKTSAPMMKCKAALQEAGGDLDKAEELIRIEMGNKAGKLAGRETSEGTVQSYIHATGKVGAMVEVDCNTDFVAKNDDFIAFARDVAMHVAAMPGAEYITEEDVPAEARERELRVFEGQAEAEGKPEQIRARIAEGKFNKWLDDHVLLRQAHVNADKHESKTIEQIRADLSGKMGENIVIRRVQRFQVGE